MDLVVNISDPSLSGLLSVVNGQVVPASARLPQLVRNDGNQLSLRFVAPSASNGRFFDDVDVSTATVRVAIGAPDLLPNAGTFYLKAGLALTSGPLVSGKRYLIASYQSGDDFANVGAGSNANGTIFTATGTTPTTWSHESSLQEITADLAFNISAGSLETALNATAAIATAGNVMVTNPIVGAYAIAWETVGAKTILGSNGNGLSPLSVVSVSRVVTGSATLKELEVVRLIQNPYCYAEPSTALPTSAYTVTQLQTGDSGKPSIQRFTLAPAPYAGTFSFVIGGLTKSAAYNISQADMQTLVGSAYVVAKSDSFAWDFQWVANGAQAAITAVVAGLSVPIGVSGELNLSTYGLFQAFNATSASNLTLTLEIELQFSATDPRTVLQIPVSIARDVIDLNNLVPSGLEGSYTQDQINALLSSKQDTLGYTVDATPGAEVNIGDGGSVLLDAEGYFTVAFANLTDGPEGSIYVDPNLELTFALTGGLNLSDSSRSSGPSYHYYLGVQDSPTPSQVATKLASMLNDGFFPGISASASANVVYVYFTYPNLGAQQGDTDPSVVVTQVTQGFASDLLYRARNLGDLLSIAAARANLQVAHLVAAPANSSSNGSVGDWAQDAGYIYICTATNTWKRVAIATW